jgi:single-stranded-DNA-specific exonuclease
MEVMRLRTNFMKYQKWNLKYKYPSVSPDLSSENLPKLLELFLAERGFSTKEEIDRFLGDGLDALCDPFLLKDMDKACARLQRALRDGEKIAVYGDYDVDGITSTCIVSQWLQAKGASVVPYIPNRLEEGYGLNMDAMAVLHEKGVSLVVTVDCGVTAVEEVNFARELGMDVIITDHHECQSEILPDAAAVVDPMRPDDMYPNPHLAGIGVAWKLLSAMDGNTLQTLRTYADYIAVGTIADVMELSPENRCVVKEGLKKLNTSPTVGFSALMQACGIANDTITASRIGFGISPRINAAGRLGNVAAAWRLLSCTNPQQAAVYAEDLCALNRQRQEIEADIWEEADGMLTEEAKTAPIVLASSRWHPGVIGIVASRLSDHYGVPAVMVCLKDDVGKGSCRSPEGFNIFEALKACSSYLEGFGGHAAAAGLTIRKENVEAFRSALADYYSAHPAPPSTLNCDLILEDPSLLDPEQVASLGLTDPQGCGNDAPVFCLSDVTLQSVSPMKDGKHSRLQLRLGNQSFSCPFFSCPPSSLGVQAGDSIDMAFTPQLNTFRGNTSVQLRVIDVRPHDGRTLCSAILEGSDDCLPFATRYVPKGREDFIKCWKVLRAGNGCPAKSIEEILNLCPSTMAPETFCLCCAVFLEQGLLRPGAGGSLCGAVIDPDKKISLNNSVLLHQLQQAAAERR